MKLRWLAESAGLALLLSFSYFAEVLFPGDIALYHHRFNLMNIVWGLLLADLVVALVILGAIVYFHHRFAPRPRAVVAAVFSAFIVLRIADCSIALFSLWHTSLNPDLSGGASLQRFWIQSMADVGRPLYRVPFMIGVTALAIWLPAVTGRFVTVLRVSLASFAFCLLWIVPKLLYCAFVLKPMVAFDHSSHVAPPAENPRVLWILLDELSYDKVFDTRPADVKLPNLDRLRNESTSFSNLRPIGYFTDRIVPSVFEGKTIANIHSDAHGWLYYLDPDDKRWVKFDANNSIFGIAKDQGWKPGVVGWYNPYCRMMQSVLVSCSWQQSFVSNLPIELLGATGDKSPLHDAAILVPAFFYNRSPDRDVLLAQRVRTLNRSMQRANALIADGNVTFGFIHLSVPHPPGFYDRKTHQFCNCGDYLDNLVLADDVLGTLLHEIEQTPWAGKTTIIVTSDHSWRVPMWRPSSAWTHEEEMVTQGRFDQRPMLLIHFPGQTANDEVQAPTPELWEHDIFAAMLQHKMQTPEDLQNFLHARNPVSLSSNQTP